MLLQLIANMRMSEKSFQTRKLPDTIEDIRALNDPCNDNNWFIFGSQGNNDCWHFINEKQWFDEIDDIPDSPDGTEGLTNFIDTQQTYAMFETKDNQNKYALIVGGCYNWVRCNIYDFKKKKWNDNNEIITLFSEKQSLEKEISMITDLFQKNKIHVIGLSEYYYFEFKDQINYSNTVLSCFKICFFFAV